MVSKKEVERVRIWKLEDEVMEEVCTEQQMKY